MYVSFQRRPAGTVCTKELLLPGGGWGWAEKGDCGVPTANSFTEEVLTAAPLEFPPWTWKVSKLCSMLFEHIFLRHALGALSMS